MLWSNSPDHREYYSDTPCTATVYSWRPDIGDREVQNGSSAVVIGNSVRNGLTSPIHSQFQNRNVVAVKLILFRSLRIRGKALILVN